MLYEAERASGVETSAFALFASSGLNNGATPPVCAKRLSMRLGVMLQPASGK
jgi:hypothetical protein